MAKKASFRHVEANVFQKDGLTKAQNATFPLTLTGEGTIGEAFWCSAQQPLATTDDPCVLVCPKDCERRCREKINQFRFRVVDSVQLALV